MAFAGRDIKGRFIKGHIGYKHTPEAIEIIRRSSLGNKSTLGRVGSMANAWKGGKTIEYRRLRSRKAWKNWRIAVFDRDNWTCQKCLKRGVNLHPHHIFNQYSHVDIVFDVDNGVTLCKKCHYEFHSRYGFKNNTEEQVISFLREGG